MYPGWSLNLTASLAQGGGADEQGHLQGENSIECNVIGGSTISWKDAVTFAGSVFSGTVAAWAEDMMKAQIKAFEKNGLTVRSRSGHGPRALLERCKARRLPACFGNHYRTCWESYPHNLYHATCCGSRACTHTCAPAVARWPQMAGGRRHSICWQHSHTSTPC